MTRVKLPHSNSAPMMKMILLSFVLFVVGGTLLWSGASSSSSSSPPQQNDSNLRSSTTADHTAAVTIQEKTQTTTPVVHTYEIILAGLKPSSSKGKPTTRAKIILETYSAWAPIGAAHFHELVLDGFYNQDRFFRVVDNFVVQFGLNGQPAMNKKWRDDVLKDDPVKKTNAYGSITYATSGPNTRTTQLFINTNPGGNAFLDKQGFAPFGQIVEGVDHVERINNEYHEQPNQHQIETVGDAYLEKNFPRLSYIESIRCLDEDPPE